jgi:hypothetical protein
VFPEGGGRCDEAARGVPFNICCAVRFANIDGHDVGVEFFVDVFIFAFVITIVDFEIELSNSSSEICERDESSLGRPKYGVQLFLINGSYHQYAIQVGRLRISLKLLITAVLVAFSSM